MPLPGHLQHLPEPFVIANGIQEWIELLAAPPEVLAAVRQGFAPVPPTPAR